MTTNIDALNESVMGIVTDFSEEYEATEAVDYASRCSALEPGATVPEKGGIKLTDNQRHIENYSFGASSKISELCSKHRESVLASMADAPSDEALRMMQAINLRGNSVTADELEALGRKYGSNYQVRKFVADQLVSRELAGPTMDECDRALALIDHAEKVGLGSVNVRGIESSPFGRAARLAIVKQDLYNEGLFAMV